VELSEFLLARIAEDEAAAKEENSSFLRNHGASALLSELEGYGLHWLASSVTTAAHVLAECEAKRRIVELHEVSVADVWVNPPDGLAYQEPERTCAICGWVPDACDTVKALALPYADHADYREEWRL
jgi:hypothetical protein